MLGLGSVVDRERTWASLIDVVVFGNIALAALCHIGAELERGAHTMGIALPIVSAREAPKAATGTPPPPTALRPTVTRSLWAIIVAGLDDGHNAGTSSGSFERSTRRVPPLSFV